MLSVVGRAQPQVAARHGWDHVYFRATSNAAHARFYFFSSFALATRSGCVNPSGPLLDGPIWHRGYDGPWLLSSNGIPFPTSLARTPLLFVS